MLSHSLYIFIAHCLRWGLQIGLLHFDMQPGMRRGHRENMQQTTRCVRVAFCQALPLSGIMSVPPEVEDSRDLQLEVDV
jgi:hypothetical protein